MDLSEYKEDYSTSFKIKRLCWYLVNATLFRWLVGGLFSSLRNNMLRLWGAKIASSSQIYSTCKIWAPWNLEIGHYVCVGPNTQLYNKARIVIGDNSVISQGSFLCTASHDINDSYHKLIVGPITIEDQVWIAADAFVGMGVHVGQGAVVGARACVFKNIKSWTVVGGNPASFIKERAKH